MTAAEIQNADGSGLLREFAGLPVVIDRPKGTLIRGTLADGTQWSRTWPVDYGYFPRTDGGDGQGLDVFLGPNPKSKRVFWTTHKNPDGTFDQLKTFLGFDQKQDASDLYALAFPDPYRGGPMKETSVALLSALLGRAPDEIMAKLAEGQPTLFDLSPADVHTPSAGGSPAAPSPTSSATAQQMAKKIAKPDNADPSKKKKKKGGLGRRIYVRADLAPGGRISVRPMKERAFYDGEGVALADAAAANVDAGPVWIQLAKSGAFAGHPAGPFELNEKVFGEIIANFTATKNRRVAIDYEHASESDPTSGSVPIMGAPAQGWIVDLAIRDTNLWALVEWLPQARDQIRGGQYKFISPAIRFNSRDRVTGKPVGARLTSAGLTNTPFLDGMAPLAAKDSAPAGDKVAQLKAVLGLHALASTDEARARLVRLRDACAESPDGTLSGVDLDDYLEPLGAIAGVADGCTVSALLDAVDTMLEGTNPTTTAAMAAKQEVTTMAEDTQAIALKDAQKKASELEVSLKDANEKTIKAELTLKDATAKIDATEKVIADASAALSLKDGETLPAAIKRIADENAKLLKDKTDREEADLVADVDRTIVHYKLSAEKKTDLLELARGARAAFNRMYPPLTDAEARLLSAVVPPESPESRKVDGAPETLSFTAMTAKVLDEAKKAGKPIQLADAQNEAVRRMKQGGG